MAFGVCFLRAFLCPAHAFGGMTIEVHRWQCKEVYDLKRAPLLDSRSGDRGLRGSACGKGEGMRQCDSLRIQYHNVIHTRQRHLPSSSIRYALLALSLTPRSHDRDYLCENMCKKVRETIERIVSRDVRRVRVVCFTVYRTKGWRVNKIISRSSLSTPQKTPLGP